MEPFQNLRTKFETKQKSGGIKSEFPGVSIITEGPAIGHGIMIDSTTLLQALSLCSEFEGGVKCKVNHGGKFTDIVGKFTNFRIEDRKLRADLSLYETSQHFAFVSDVLSTMSESIGVSIQFSGDAEDVGGVLFARIKEIFSVDIVDEPAANPDGLYERQIMSDVKTNQDQPFLHQILTGIASLRERFSTVSENTTQLAKLSTEVSEWGAKYSALNAEFSELKKQSEALAAEKTAQAAKIVELESARDKAVSDLKSAHDIISAPDSEIEKRANVRLTQLCAKLGVNPIKETDQAENPSNPKQPKLVGLSARAEHIRKQLVA